MRYYERCRRPILPGFEQMVVHAKNDDARALYEHFDFTPSPSDPYHLFRLVKDIRAFLD